jgi:hypothetical protein
VKGFTPLAVIKGSGFGDPPAAWGDFARYVHHGAVVDFLGPDRSGKTST